MPPTVAPLLPLFSLGQTALIELNYTLQLPFSITPFNFPLQVQAPKQLNIAGGKLTCEIICFTEHSGCEPQTGLTDIAAIRILTAPFHPF